MDSNTVLSIVESLMQSARENFLRDGYLCHAAIMINEKGDHGVVGLEYKSQAEKDIVSAKLQKTVDKFKPAIMVQITEAWMNRPKDDNAKDVYEAAVKGELSSRHDSEEIIHIVVESKLLPNGGFFAFSKIQRNGKDFSLSEWEMQSLPVVGRFARFLK